MSYVDAIKIADTVHVVERINGQRIFKKAPALYRFYAKSKKGAFDSMYGDKLIKYESNNYKEFQKEKQTVSEYNLFEDDYDAITRHLEENYLGCDAPKLNIGFLDIEVDFDPKRGFSSPEDPHGKITAITVYQNWTGKLLTYVIGPPTLTFMEAKKITDQFEDTILCKTEDELFDHFFTAIEDADVLTGWNSTTFDIPYIIKRIEFVSKKEKTKRFCLWNQYPSERRFEMYGKTQLTYELVGRIHLDYLDLYKKYTYNELHSYSLDNVSEVEVKERKTAYEGSLDQLYKKDFKTFIEYNRQDVMLIVKIDAKNQYIDLSNQLAHENTVLITKTSGSVALIEQAINIEVHSKGLIAPRKKGRREGESSESVAGAYVADPKVGMHQWIGSVDINSLYPSAIRALNISPETIIGQFQLPLTEQFIRNFLASNKGATLSDAWGELFNVIEFDEIVDCTTTILTVETEDGQTITQSAREWYETIFAPDSGMCISANGTLFKTENDGIIPGLLARWYAERKQLQGEMKKWIKEMDAARARNASKEEMAEIQEKIAFYDKRQLIKKILLNSLYGALLNQYCRYYDQRMGQSTTLTGRNITRHMMSKINEFIAGEYNHNGPSIVYGDTDSCYFSAYPVLKEHYDWNKETVAELYDNIADLVNESFPEFMRFRFNTSLERGAIIAAGREILAERGMYLKKKRYAALCYDIDGKRVDIDGKPGKLKALGIEIKRSDTPKVIQNFLTEVLMKVLDGTKDEEIYDFVDNFRTEFREWPGWKKGSPKGANGITGYVEREEQLGKVNMPGHVRAAMNWNNMKKRFDDHYSNQITDGMKVMVCKLLDNPLGLTSIAYPVDQTHLPDWFMDLPFDHKAMEEALLDKKLSNIFGAVGYSFSSTKASKETFEDLFSFD